MTYARKCGIIVALHKVNTVKVNSGEVVNVMVNTYELKRARCRAGYFTAKSFAKALDITYAKYRTRENGIVPFTAQEIVKVCELLDMTLEDGIKILV